MFDSLGVVAICLFLSGVIVWQYVGWRKQKEEEEAPTEEEMDQYFDMLEAEIKRKVDAIPLHIEQPNEIYCVGVYVGSGSPYKPSIINYFKDKRGERVFSTNGDLSKLSDDNYVREVIQHKIDCTQWLIDKGYLS